MPLGSQRNSTRHLQDPGHCSNVWLCSVNPEARHLQSVLFILFVRAWTNVWLCEAACFRECKQSEGRHTKKCHHNLNPAGEERTNQQMNGPETQGFTSVFACFGIMWLCLQFFRSVPGMSRMGLSCSHFQWCQQILAVQAEASRFWSWQQVSVCTCKMSADASRCRQLQAETC